MFIQEKSFESVVCEMAAILSLSTLMSEPWHCHIE